MITMIQSENSGVYAFPLEIKGDVNRIDEVWVNGQRVNNFIRLASNEIEIPLVRPGDKVLVSL